jgi:ubiquinone/menaquinone biosynthesis C-methylase UbiE
MSFLERKFEHVFAFNQYERDRFVKEWAARLPPGSHVLDVGAGPCHYKPLFSHCHYFAQDFAKYEGSIHGPLADKGQWSYGKLDFISDATCLPLPDQSFDAILCTEVIEHVPEPITVIHELGRILRPGAKILMAAPLGSGLHQEPYHYYGGYTPYWYRKFLIEAGFTEVQVTPNGGFFKHYAQESQRFSSLTDPRRLPGSVRYLLLPLWLLTLPWFRCVLPLACYYLDDLDTHKGFTVGYHVTAVRK